MSTNYISKRVNLRTSTELKYRIEEIIASMPEVLREKAVPVLARELQVSRPCIRKWMKTPKSSSFSIPEEKFIKMCFLLEVEPFTLITDPATRLEQKERKLRDIILQS